MKWLVVLVLEGDFGCETNSKKMIMQKLQDSLKIKLDWLNCQVSVVDTNTYNSRFFNIT